MEATITEIVQEEPNAFKDMTKYHLLTDKGTAYSFKRVSVGQKVVLTKDKAGNQKVADVIKDGEQVTSNWSKPSFNNNKYKADPEKTDSIQRQQALIQAVAVFGHKIPIMEKLPEGAETIRGVLQYADAFYDWLKGEPNATPIADVLPTEQEVTEADLNELFKDDTPN